MQAWAFLDILHFPVVIIQKSCGLFQISLSMTPGNFSQQKISLDRVGVKLQLSGDHNPSFSAIIQQHRLRRSVDS